MKLFKAIKTTITWIFIGILIFILTIAFFSLIGVIQERIFLPYNYLMWIFKYPLSVFIYIYEFYIIFIIIFMLNKSFREFIMKYYKGDFTRKFKKLLIYIFIILNIFLMYMIIFNVAVITNNKIINYNFYSPKGKQYNFNDIKEIEAGVSGSRKKFPYAHYPKGEFYYIIKLKDGTKVHLTDVGGTNGEDPRFIIEKIDQQLVSLGINKITSMDNFEYCTKHLDKIYTDKIRNILLNTNIN